MSGFVTFGAFPQVGNYTPCVPEVSPSSVGAGTSYPVGMSLAAAVELVWRVKTLTLAFSLNLPSAGDWGTTPIDVSGTAAGSTRDSSGALSLETDLIKGEGYFQTISTSPTSEPYEAGDLDFGAVVQVLHTGPPLVRVGSVYYPGINISGGITYIDPDAGFFDLLTFNSHTSDGLTDRVLCTFMGASVTLSAFFTYPGTETGGGTVTITPTEWWPYDLGEGPTWDDSTGALLKPPNILAATFIRQ